MASSEPSQNLKEYDPEWGGAFWAGTVAASCRHDRMLSSVKVPVLLTQHFWMIEEKTGSLAGALSGDQATRARQLIEAAGQKVSFQSFPTMGHSMHGQDPQLFSTTLVEWAATLGR
jgi:hypothetical protein